MFLGGSLSLLLTGSFEIDVLIIFLTGSLSLLLTIDFGINLKYFNNLGC